MEKLATVSTLSRGKTPNPPKLALQVLDIEPEEWAAEALEPFKDVLGNPVAWAKKCVDTYKADIVCLWLQGTDPNGKNLPAEHAAKVAKEVAEAINVPLIVWGTSNDDKNTEVLKAVAESCAGLNVVIGPVTEGNYKQVGAAAIAYKHVVAANSPIDINLAKQLNILLENLGVPNDKILIDPTTGSVGYGMEYCYSIMERIRQAALTQNDDKLQYPIINNIAEEVWKTKEAKLPTKEEPKLGDAGVRAINLESITGLSALQAGSDILILRHPKTLEHIRKYLSNVMIETTLDAMGVDMSLVGEAPAAETKAAPRRSRGQACPCQTRRAEGRGCRKACTRTQGRESTPHKEMPAAAAKPADEQEEALMQLPNELIKDLKEMVSVFKALRSAFGGEARSSKRPGRRWWLHRPRRKRLALPTGHSIPSTLLLSKV